ncbi:hypothetical protein M3Y98_00483900 [Aphelenchoides besseyi]|nr:hypothetical protein M3Y98_00483900 [Aphelenchoides besseyi]KAI6207606.1 hypothetical protein M3Y96_00026800 [Aphelenchoides besseyi]KAI6207631.1 hypothetical protein M3Y96_00029500 [Aphelenchoides besseyi]
MGYGDPDDFMDRTPLLPDLQQQLLESNLATHNFGVKALHAAYAALSDPEPPSTSSAEHDDPDESYWLCFQVFLSMNKLFERNHSEL